MGPDSPLPLPPGYTNTEEYVEALLRFVTTSDLFQLLVGGVHILDFFVRSPDIYAWLLDAEWRNWFELHTLQDILDFILREDMAIFASYGNTNTDLWRGQRLPPESFVKYISAIRDLSLTRDFQTAQPNGNSASHDNCDPIPRHTASGMNVKKKHEVDHFARYIQKLTVDIAASTNSPITHLVDFGSGQNYLGRTLASRPYNKHVIAVESKPHNVAKSKEFDIFARIAPKPIVMVNKKLFRAKQEKLSKASNKDDVSLPDSNPIGNLKDTNGASAVFRAFPGQANRAQIRQASSSVGSVQYVHHRLEDGNLAAVVNEIIDGPGTEEVSVTLEYQKLDSGNEIQDSPMITVKLTKDRNPNLMIISLHSCGNLSHHGLRSLVLNHSVSAVCLVGCCYNLVTERLTPATYKLSSLRLTLLSDSNCVNGLNGDPHGFPMSAHICQYRGPHVLGVHFNITARMLAVQAPQNWGPKDSEGFFKRHFYRALLQKIFLERGVVQAPEKSESWSEDYQGYVVGGKCDASVGGGSAQPIIIGNLRKSCYTDFVSYVRGAVEKLQKDPDRGNFFTDRLGSLSHEAIKQYADKYGPRRKDLSIVWSLMAYSAALVEAVIVVDRWLWLKEQEEVGECWVEPVFDYGKSPRNLVVVGLKK